MTDQEPARTVTDGRTTIGFVFAGSSGGFVATDSLGEIIGDDHSIDGAVDLIVSYRRGQALASDV